MLKAIIKYQFLSFKRIKMTTFIAPPDFIAIILSIIFFSFITTAIAAEKPFRVNDLNILNYNYIVFLIYLFTFFFEAYILNFYTPNYKYIKLIYPLKLKQQIFIDVLSEMFSYKIFLFTFLFISFFSLKSSYNITLFNNLNIFGILLIMLTYLNSCLLIRIIKDKMKSKAFDFHKNFFKLFFILLLIIATINNNLEILNFTEVKVLYILLFSSFILASLFIIILFAINSKLDKV